MMTMFGFLNHTPFSHRREVSAHPVGVNNEPLVPLFSRPTTLKVAVSDEETVDQTHTGGPCYYPPEFYLRATLPLAWSEKEMIQALRDTEDNVLDTLFPEFTDQGPGVLPSLYVTYRGQWEVSPAPMDVKVEGAPSLMYFLLVSMALTYR